MSKGSSIALLGFIVLLTPFLGIPLAAKTTLLVVVGILAMGLGLLMREERRWLMRALSGDHEKDAYTESAVPGASRIYEEASRKS